MEEISKTAKAYYANLSEKHKQSAADLFKAIDEDGDGKISFEEYSEFMKKKFRSISSVGFFKKLDKDGNGTLDFEEFITVQYLYSSERVYSCDGCKVFLEGTYFTCVKCFKNSSGNTFDLCCNCYGNKTPHHHSLFLDNYTLLQAMRNKNQGNTDAATALDFGMSTTENVVSLVSSCLQM